jgi:FkbM family methyltransferase
MHVRDDLRLANFLKLFDIDLVLDVGANKGQFAHQLFDAGYSGRIVSFEALPDAHKQLSEAAAKSNGSWIIGPRFALSDRSGVARFYVTDADTASSLLPPSEELISATPQTHISGIIDVPTARLDDLTKDIAIPVANCFLKMDVQGGEALVMAGAPETLMAARGVMTELSITTLYESQPAAQEVLCAIYKAGFEIWDIWQGYRDPKTYRLNQIDIICFKPQPAVDT